MIKYRGNFLNAASADKFEANHVDFKESFENLNDGFANLDGLTPFQINTEHTKEIGSVLLDSTKTHNDRQRLVAKLLPVSSETTKKRDKKIATQLAKLILGMKANTAIIFGIDPDDSEPYKINLSDEDSDSKLNTLNALLNPDQNEIMSQLIHLYSAIMLNEIIPNGEGLSESMLNKYVKHHQQLKELKDYVKTVDQKAAVIIRDLYDQYIGVTKRENNFDFAKQLKRQLNDSELGKKIAKEIDSGDYMPKQRTGENGVIPHQVHQIELRQIIENQSQYYPWLAELNPNEHDRTQSKYKIEQLLYFRVPYYVGPMIDPDIQAKTSGAHFAWAKFRDDRPKEEINPWNFEQQIDREKSATAFVKRMTTKDTYLLTEDVLPAASLIYQRFTVLNELNNVRINGRHMTNDQKQAIYRDLFQNGRFTTVSVKSLQTWFSDHENTISPVEVKGLADDKKFNSNLRTYRDLVKILGHGIVDDASKRQDLEQIIEWVAVFEDSRITKKMLTQISWLSNKQRDSISNLRYRGWGRLSKKLLTGLLVNGQSILDRMWVTQQNFAQIVHSPEYAKAISEYNNKKLNNSTGSSKDIVEQILDDAYTSPQNKKAIRQVILVVQDIEKAVGCYPASISLEFARNNEESKRTVSRKKRLDTVFKTTAKELVEKTELSDQLKNVNDLTDRLYLYFTQAGRDVYTGLPINIDQISTNYDIDHIYPQSFIKDDSLDNKVLVSKPVNASTKSDQVPYELFGRQMKSFWHQLLDAGLITKRKYKHLTTNPYSLNKYEKQGFIHRQLVETRQVIKLAANILSEMYGEETKIFETRAKNTRQLRSIYHLYKVREVNDYHHAVDAYLTVFGSQYLYKRYPNLRRLFTYGQFLKADKSRDNWHTESLNLFRNLDSEDKFYQPHVIDKQTGEIIVDSQAQAKYIRQIQHYKVMLVSKEVYQKAAAMFGATLYPAKSAGRKKLVPVKDGKDVSLYGGYTKEQTSYMSIIRINSKKPKFKIVNVPTLGLQSLNKAKRRGERDYLNCLHSLILIKERMGSKTKNFDIILPKVLFNQLIVDGDDIYTVGSAEVKHNYKQLVLSDKSLKYLADNFQCVKQLSKVKQDQVLLSIFDEIVKKMNCYYPLYDSAQYRRKVTNGRDKFEKLPPFDIDKSHKGKSSTINNLLKGLHANADKPKMPEFKIPFFGYFNPRSGIILSQNAVLYYQSPTGLFVRKVRLSELAKDK